ncbi:MAG: SUMF1/EgtB/PvdO family nonheme iron enzyme, partial [Tannerellaceae bacterium]
MNPIYRAILGCILFCIFISGTAQSLSKNKRMPDPQPPGMVLIKSGSIEFNQLLAKDSLIDTPLYRQGASFSSFWMDKHEVTNQMYREFVVWVRDSIIRERLADPNLGDNELFKIDEDEYGDPISPYLDWSQKIPWKNGSDEELAAIESLFCIDPISGEKR